MPLDSCDDSAPGTTISLRVHTSGLHGNRTLQGPGTALQKVELTTLDRFQVQATIYWSCHREGAVVPVGAAFPLEVPAVRRKRGFFSKPTERSWEIKIGQGCTDMNATLSVSAEGGAVRSGKRSWIPEPVGPVTIDLHLKNREG